VLAAALASLDHRDTRIAVEAERHLLAILDAGCAAPVAAHAFIDAGLLFLTAEVYSPSTGEALSGPAILPTRSFPLQIVDDVILLDPSSAT
jgi:porphobilinogen deaminase